MSTQNDLVKECSESGEMEWGEMERRRGCREGEMQEGTNKSEMKVRRDRWAKKEGERKNERTIQWDNGKDDRKKKGKGRRKDKVFNCKK